MTDARPFRILGIQQIAIGGEDKHRLRSLWVDLLGFTFKRYLCIGTGKRQRRHLCNRPWCA
jgi:hypothetical protein